MNITLNQAKDYIPALWKANIVPFLHSSPAIGKSSLVKQLAKQFNCEVIDLRLTELDSSDLNGLPTFEDGHALFKPFNTFPLEGQELPKDKVGWILLLDEFNSASPAVQASAYRLVLDRQVGQYRLHPNVRIIACGNKEEDNAIVNEMSSALISRFAHFYINLDVDTWLDWAYQNDINNHIITFIQFRKELLYTFDPDANTPYASPRTWEMLSKVLTYTEADLNLCASLVGYGTANEFISYLKLFKSLVSLKDILEKPNEAQVPEELSIKWATLSMLVNQLDKDNIKQVLLYVDRFPAELKVVFAKLIKYQKPKLILSKEITQWFSSVIREVG